MDKSGLPRWLSHPLVISNTSIDPTPLDPADIELFDALGIEGLFPFQGHVRNRLRSRHPEGWRDLCVSAPTGSGKTLAYALPIVETLRHRIVGRLRAIIVVPTRDLIGQVEDTFRAVSEAYKCPDLKSGIDFLVTTPGKLIVMLPELKFESLKFLIVDEADRLLDQSFQEWLPQLLSALKLKQPTSLNQIGDVFDSEAWYDEGDNVKKLLFSATLTTNPAKISPLNLYRPLYITVRSDESMMTTGTESIGLVTPETLKENVAVFNGAEELKPAALLELLDIKLPGMVSRILCFTKSVSSAQRLSRLLSLMRPELCTASFHGHLSDNDRSRILCDFDANKIQILVGSDAMARGLDLKNVRCVINYDVPMFAATYVHRVGRTARAGQSGLAITLLPSGQMRHFKQMLKNSLKKLIVDRTEELKLNEVGKIEINENILNTKWRLLLVESLKQLRDK